MIAKQLTYLLRRYVLLIVTLCLSFVMMGQTEEEQIENILEMQQKEDFDFELQLEKREELSRNPVELNKAQFDELLDAGLLTEELKFNLEDHIRKHGKLLSLLELQSIPGFEPEVIRQLLPYVSLNRDLSDLNVGLGDVLSDGKWMFLLRAQQNTRPASGYTEEDTTNRYLGDPYKLLFKFKYSYGSKFSYALTAEKDAGEQFFRGNQKSGFDFYSGHIYASDLGPVKQLVLGDYQINLGQGLLMWSAYGFSKGSQTCLIRKDARVIRPYSSAAEYGFLRGGAIHLEKRDFHLTLFGSYRAADAKVYAADSSMGVEEDYISSLDEDGLHRSQDEYQNKNSIQIFSSGGNFSFQKKRFHLGLNTIYQQFSIPIQSSDAPYNDFDLRSDRLLNMSLDYHYTVANLHFFGEEAYSLSSNSFAALNGLIMSLDRRLDLAILHRYYDKKYQSISANAFGEQSSTNNEHGFYIGTTVKPFSKWTLNAYMDFYRFPWLKFAADRPSGGHDYLLQLGYAPDKLTSMYLRYKFEQKEENIVGNTEAIDPIGINTRQNLRLNFGYKLSPTLSCRSRAEAVWSLNEESSPSKGFAIYQDLNFNPKEFPLDISSRLMLFQTDDYDSRIYAYENDVLYSSSVPAVSGKGLRYYLIVHYKFLRHFDLWLRYAETYYSDRMTIGTGLDETNGPAKGEIKAQLRFQF